LYSISTPDQIIQQFDRITPSGPAKSAPQSDGGEAALRSQGGF
jgi:hypothetical protein